ncbi:hypothetical protein Y017_07915 [Alcanivorax sp. 97CO-5]|nr:hypothetical protein Y017_07915 [Alcanivorax sp. 97CO-5]
MASNIGTPWGHQFRMIIISGGHIVAERSEAGTYVDATRITPHAPRREEAWRMGRIAFI